MALEGLYEPHGPLQAGSAGVFWHMCNCGSCRCLRRLSVSLRRAHGRGCVLHFQGLHELCGVWAVGVFCGVVAKDVCV